MDGFHDYIVSYGVSENLARIIVKAISLGLISVLSVLAEYLSSQVLLRMFKQLIVRSKSKGDDFLLHFKVLDKLFLLVPLFVFHSLSKLMFNDHSMLRGFLTHLSGIVIVIVVVVTLDAALDMLLAICNRYRIAVAVPLKSFVQVLKVIISLVAVILVVSTLLGKTPIYILSGMGALTAVLMLIFKDPILGLVAGIQLSQNDMVRIGDWIEMPKYGADGYVIDLALTTVKVRNFDNTVTTVPTYALISDSFKNWRPMSESGGRRIKRSLYIDLTSVRFCTEEMLKRFSRIQYIADYILKKQDEIQRHNVEYNVDLESLANGRRMTNLGVLRAYMTAYLRNHPKINKEMTLMVRQLEPTPQGLPLEVYCFSADKGWVNYEGVQADIFDHFLSVVAAFDLRLFQNPSGADFTTAFKLQS